MHHVKFTDYFTRVYTKRNKHYCVTFKVAYSMAKKQKALKKRTKNQTQKKQLPISQAEQYFGEDWLDVLSEGDEDVQGVAFLQRGNARTQMNFSTATLRV